MIREELLDNNHFLTTKCLRSWRERRQGHVENLWKHWIQGSMERSSRQNRHGPYSLISSLSSKELLLMNVRLAP